MKLIKYANGKQTIKLTKAEWENIGKTAGWDTEENLNRRKDYLNRLPVEYKPSKYDQEDDKKQFVTHYKQPEGRLTNINKDLDNRKLNELVDRTLSKEEEEGLTELFKEMIKLLIKNGINFNNRPFSKKQLQEASREINDIYIPTEFKGLLGLSAPMDLLYNLEGIFEKINENEFILNYSSWKILFNDLFKNFVNL